MAAFLYRLGRSTHRNPRWVALAWVFVLAVVGLGAVTLSKALSSSFSIPGTEAQRALTLLQERVPQMGAGQASARVVFVARNGATVTTPASQQAIAKAVTQLKALPGVASVADPFATRTVSPQGGVAFATVTYAVTSAQVTAEQRDQLQAAGRAAQSGDLAVEFGGDAFQTTPAEGASEALGLAVAAVVLVVTFGSLVAAGLPLLTAVVSVGLGTMGIEIATRFFDLGSTTLTLALMLGLAVGIDYALFIMSRYRHELLKGHGGDEAAGRAVATAGSAVVFAGATVVIALAALSVVGIPFLTAMGLAAAGTVACAVLVALTLLPALLSFLGRRMLGRSARGRRDVEGDLESGTAAMPFGERWARAVVRRRVAVVVAVLAGLGVLAVPVLGLRLGMPSDATAAADSTQRRAYDAVTAGFGPGFNAPLVIVADLAGVPSADRTAVIGAVRSDLSKLPDVAVVAPPSVTPAGDTAVYTVVPASGPDDKATVDLVGDIRAAAPGWQVSTGADVAVTGTTALNIDISAKLQGALLPYLAVVVGLSFVLLTIVFRSLLVPLKATAGFLLSLAATLGAVVAVFQWGWLGGLLGVGSAGPILSFLPIIVIGILFGLAMDYEVFLVTRMREEHVHGAAPDDAVIGGFRHGARIVTAAGLIMASVFAGFMLSSDSIIKSMGFALAVGVLLDAFVVRMTLVPAVMSLMGRHAWTLPQWLDRVVPNLDVEGATLGDTPAGPSGLPADDGDRDLARI